jgi:hypothetical protein
MCTNKGLSLSGGCWGEYISLLPEKSADMRKEKKRVGSQQEAIMSKSEQSVSKRKVSARRLKKLQW